MSLTALMSILQHLNIDSLLIILNEGKTFCRQQPISKYTLVTPVGIYWQECMQGLAYVIVMYIAEATIGKSYGFLC